MGFNLKSGIFNEIIILTLEEYSNFGNDNGTKNLAIRPLVDCNPWLTKPEASRKLTGYPVTVFP
jgi:hypothetical protein